jgi:hypothetical protein
MADVASACSPRTALLLKSNGVLRLIESETTAAHSADALRQWAGRPEWSSVSDEKLVACTHRLSSSGATKLSG